MKKVRITCRGAATLPVEKLVGFQGNLKTLDPANAKKLKKEILDLGFAEPISVWKHGGKNYILNGHQRLAVLIAMRAEGHAIPEVPVNWIEARDVADAKRKVLALTSQYGSMDLRGLREFIGGTDITMQEIAASFTYPDIGAAIEREIEREERGGKTDEDQVPAPPPAKTRRSDCIALGQHRLICGDATEPEDMQRLLGDRRADMVFTDPPYNIDYRGRGRKTSEGMMNDDQSADAFKEFLEKTFGAWQGLVKKDAAMYICHATRTQAAFEAALHDAGIAVRATIIWNKMVASMGWGDYRWKHEPIFYASFGGKQTRYFGDRAQYTVWDESWDIKKIEKRLQQIARREVKGGSTVWTLSRETDYLHPTQKPVELIKLAIQNSSKRDDLVLDPFGGSGSTMIAAEVCGRVCAMIELDPRFCDVIVRRWEQFTGGRATRRTKPIAALRGEKEKS